MVAERESRAPAAESPAARWIGIGFAAFLAAAGVYFTLTAFGFGITAEGTPIGPGAVPAGLGVLLVVSAVVVLVGDARALRGGARRSAPATGGLGTPDGGTPDEPTPEAPDDGAGRTEHRTLLRAALVVALLGCGLALTQVVGMVLGLAMAVVAICLVVERMPPVRALLLGAVTAVLLWLVFGVLLSVNFPSSMIGL
ncbi:tripartite tricarboxylate transporter TctB family protein [Georgenia alba]|uniref:Tripartite tricarboxylate transporter TctB family protein n=1 Tax=Georgenia alba TaxID=2233858 RepID=A0ABW2Q8J6_9MICO